MSEKIISEIIDLVNGVITKSGAIPVLKATGRDAAAKWTTDRLNEEYEAIRAKLHEVLERKPMTEEDAYDLTHSAGPDLVALGQKWLENEIHVYQYAHQAEAIVTKAVRDTERFHGIGS